MGIGMLIATIIMAGIKIDYQIGKAQIEDKARSMGMVYPDEVKVLNDKGVGK